MKVLFYLVCFFPFVKWFGIGMESDVQPYSLIFAFLLILYYGINKKIKMSRTIYGFYFIVIFGMLAGTLGTILFSEFGFSRTLRYYATYISMILVSLYSYLLCKEDDGIDEKIIKIVINVYLIVGIIQKFVNSTFCYAIVANARTSARRGVISLASEPSFYGYMCIFLMIFVWNFKKGKLLYLFNLLFQICFVAKSAITMLYIAILLSLILLVSLDKVSIKKILIILGALIAGGIVVYYLLNSKENENQRIVMLLRIILSESNIKGIVNVVMKDASMFQRVDAIAICLEGFIKSFGIPNGFDTKKISSGFGSMLLTMGWFGAVMVGMIFNFIKNAYSNKEKWVISIFVTGIMFSGIQVSNPIFLFFLGYCMYEADKKKNTAIKIKGKITKENVCKTDKYY